MADTNSINAILLDKKTANPYPFILIGPDSSLQYDGSSAASIYFYNDVTLTDVNKWIYALGTPGVSWALAEKLDNENIITSSINMGNFAKFAVIGDSFAAGSTYYEDSTSSSGYSGGDQSELAWGQVLARKYGNTCINASTGGLSTKTWYEGFEPLMDYNGSYWPLTECDLVLLCLGGNDIYQGIATGTIADVPASDFIYGDDVTASTYGYYGAIIQLLLSNTSAKLILSTVVCPTDTTNQTAFDALNAAIIELAEHYEIPYVDLRNDPFITSTYYSGNFRNDHPNGMAYTGLAAAMDRLVAEAIATNPDYFGDYIEPNSDNGFGSKNPNALTVTGAVSGTYDGSEAVSIEIPTYTIKCSSGALTLTGSDGSTSSVGVQGNVEDEVINSDNLASVNYVNGMVMDLEDIVDANTSARHTHSNKTVLDSITGIASSDTQTINHTDLVDYSLLDDICTDLYNAFPTSLKNPNALTFTLIQDGTDSSIEYDGSEAKTIDIYSDTTLEDLSSHSDALTTVGVALAIAGGVHDGSLFVWGDETATGDAEWWANLKTWAASATASERSACVGKTKSVTLTSAVSGTTTHLVRCIGADIDGTGTLTFQTSNCMATATTFGSSAAYSGSTVESLCTSYYDAFPGKSYIKSLSKGTNTEYNTSSVSYATYYVWLPSIYEVGLSSYTYKPVGAEYTSGVSTAYPYYSSNSTRIKTLGDDGSATVWWTRSRGSYISDNVCRVSSSGGAGSNSYSYSFGLAPAFCIG